MTELCYFDQNIKTEDALLPMKIRTPPESHESKGAMKNATAKVEAVTLNQSETEAKLAKTAEAVKKLEGESEREAAAIAKVEGEKGDVMQLNTNSFKFQNFQSVVLVLINSLKLDFSLGNFGFSSFSTDIENLSTHQNALNLS
jgi:hypothetical protein